MRAFAPQYFAGEQPPAPGAALALEPGLLWARLPLPLALDHVNVWLLDDGDGWTVIDTGLATDASRSAWEQLFATDLGGRPVRRVLCTHMHPDHVGLADWLCSRWNAPLWMPQGEYLSARLLSAALAPADVDGWAAFFRSHGASAAQCAELAQRSGFYARMVRALPATYQRIAADQTLQIGGAGWQVQIGGGHSPEHAALWCAERDWLIAGDMLLPRISTNVSVYPVEPDADPLQQYLQALHDFEHLPPSTRVLPSHGLPFVGASARARQLRQHHAERLAEVAVACAGAPHSAIELVPLLFRRALDAHQLGFAFGEAVAHAHRLWHAGLLLRERGADGVWRFAASAALDAEHAPVLAYAAAGCSAGAPA